MCLCDRLSSSILMTHATLCIVTRGVLLPYGSRCPCILQEILCITRATKTWQWVTTSVERRWKVEGWSFSLWRPKQWRPTNEIRKFRVGGLKGFDGHYWWLKCKCGHRQLKRGLYSAIDNSLRGIARVDILQLEKRVHLARYIANEYSIIRNTLSRLIQLHRLFG